MDLNLDNVSEYFKDNMDVPEEFYENVLKASNIYNTFQEEASKGRVLKDKVYIPIKNDKHELALVISQSFSFSDDITVIVKRSHDDRYNRWLFSISENPILSKHGYFKLYGFKATSKLIDVVTKEFSRRGITIEVTEKDYI